MDQGRGVAALASGRSLEVGQPPRFLQCRERRCASSAFFDAVSPTVAAGWVPGLQAEPTELVEAVAHDLVAAAGQLHLHATAGADLDKPRHAGVHYRLAELKYGRRGRLAGTAGAPFSEGGGTASERPFMGRRRISQSQMTYNRRGPAFCPAILPSIPACCRNKDSRSSLQRQQRQQNEVGGQVSVGKWWAERKSRGFAAATSILNAQRIGQQDGQQSQGAGLFDTQFGWAERAAGNCLSFQPVFGSVGLL
jgi:hypothetical protein